MRGHRGSGPLFTALLVLLAAAGWAFLGPVQFGGPASYVITHGVSMQPLIHQGDLVVTRRAAEYQVGDIIAYRWARGTIVLHRIVRQEGEHFVTKGDNNDFIDSARPGPDDVVGKLWLHLPSAGLVLEQLRAPRTVALLVAIVAVVGVLGRQRRRFRRRHGRGRMSNGSGRPAGNPTTPQHEALAIAAVAALICLGLVAVAFSRPLVRTVQTSVPYQQSGTFRYSGAASSSFGGVYQSGQVASGEPIYFRLVRVLDLGFDYRVSSLAPHHAQGTYQLSVELAEGSGWKRTVQLVPATPFQGDRVSIAASLDLQGVQALMNNFDFDTAGGPADFTLSIIPQITTTGSVGGAPLDEQFSPRLAFKLDRNRMILDKSSGGSEALSPSQFGNVMRPRHQENELALPFVRLSVLQARLFALLGAIVAGAAAAILALPLLSLRNEDEPARIRARYSGMLLDVHGAAEAIPDQRIVDLLCPDDLAKIAEREGRMILHSNGSDVHHYLVSDGELVYRYRARSTAHRRSERRDAWRLSRR